jgi:hypothetical protein
MSYIHLSTEEMVEVSRKWVTPKGTILDGQEVPTLRPDLEAIPLALAMIPLLEEAHNGLLSLHKAAPEVPTALPEIKEDAHVTDIRYDDLFRGLYWLLTSLASLIADDETSEDLLLLREYLFPEGLATINLTYRREAGFAAMLEGRLDDGRAKMLDLVKLQFGSFSSDALTLIRELISKGKRLGLLEDAKDKILGEKIVPVTETNRRDQRNLWIKRAKGLEYNLLNFAGISSELEKKLLGPLREAESRALGRVKEQALKAAKELVKVTTDTKPHPEDGV